MESIVDQMVELDAVLDYIQPTKYIVKSTNYSDEYEVPVLTAGQTLILGYTNETDGIYEASKEKPVIIFDDFTTSFHLIDFPFKVKSSAMKLLVPKKNTNCNLNYIYHAMKCIDYVPKEHARQWIQTYSKFKIYLPKEEEQNQISDFLDSFSSLNRKLLEEQKCRKQEFKYMLEKLINNSTSDCEQMTMDKIYSFQYGEGNTIPTIGGDYPVYGSNGIVGTHNKFNSEDAPVIGHIGAYAGIVNWGSGKHFVTYNGVICNKINDTVLPRFGYYLLLTQDYMSKANAGSQPFVSYNILNEPTVSVPNIDKQKEIITVLDCFDKFINETIPKEIELRTQQYKYFLNELIKKYEVKSND